MRTFDPEIQAIQIQDFPDLGVGGGEHLEAPIQAEAIHLVGVDPAAHALGALQEQERDVRFVKAQGAAQPGEAASNDENPLVRTHGTLPRMT